VRKSGAQLAEIPANRRRLVLFTPVQVKGPRTMTRRNDTVNDMSTSRSRTDGATARESSLDFEIRNRVLQEMQHRSNLDLSLLSIQVRDGIVTLRGEVPNIVELSNLAQAIRAIPAVHELRSQLTVRTTPHAPRPQRITPSLASR
jgi:osmotically-inducible protein OsmY